MEQDFVHPQYFRCLLEGGGHLQQQPSEGCALFSRKMSGKWRALADALIASLVRFSPSPPTRKSLHPAVLHDSPATQYGGTWTRRAR